MPVSYRDGQRERHVDLVFAEIGSTTTVVSAYDGVARGAGREPDDSGPEPERSHPSTVQPSLIGMGAAPTTVAAGNVTDGLRRALADLARRMDPADPPVLRWRRMLASSSAAGGLRMSVHGLVHDMTVRAAKEAALGAGAVVHMVTAGLLSGSEVARLQALRPNIILLAGGVDWGERDTVLANARTIAEAIRPPVPVVYAGNAAAAPEAQETLAAAGFEVRVVPNVYPRIDDLDVRPARRAIQEVFEEHIVEAPGMGRIRELVDGRIVPTPGAVMSAAEMLYESLGDLMVVDVGGATTDVHSVTPGSEEIARLTVSPEPVAKRTVEGDLGVYRNAARARELLPAGYLEQVLGATAPEVEAMLARIAPVPADAQEAALVSELAKAAAGAAVGRHAGRLRHLYGPGGRTTVAEGKDLTRVRWIIGTGGALTRLPGGHAALESLRDGRPGREMWPSRDAETLLDRHYVMAACGVILSEDRQAALRLLVRSLGVEGTEG